MAHEPKVGEYLGHYQLVKKLAVGGMGVIFKGYEESLHRYVAVKVLSPQLAAKRDFVEQFMQEARAVANLNHPNVIQIYYIGNQEGVLFFAMELVQGQNLETLVQQHKQLNVREAIGFIRQAAIGLRHAQQRGVIHRDIKPTNLMVTLDGVVKLTDFGLARNVRLVEGGAPGQTFAGTPEYVSPEEIKGEPVDHRSDIYSLGVTLFQLLAGRPPFAGKDPKEIIRQHLSSPPPPMGQFNLKVPPPVIRVVTKMLAKPPAARYQSYDQLIRDLDASLITPKFTPAAEEAVLADEEAQPEKTSVGVIVAALALTACIWGGVWWVASKRKPAPPGPPPPTTTTQPAPPVVQPRPPTPANRESEARELFAKLKQAAEDKLVNGMFGDALDVYSQWPGELDSTEARNDVRQERRRIRDMARQVWADTNRRAADLRSQKKFTEALAMYEEAKGRFRGLTDILSEIWKQEELVRQERADGQVDQAAARIAAEREKELRLDKFFEPVTSLLVTMQFEKAQQELSRLAAPEDLAIPGRLAQLRTDLDRLAALKKAVILRMPGKNPAELKLATRTGEVQGKIVEAYSDALVLQRRVGEYGTVEVTTHWAELAPASALKLLAAYFDARNADELLGYAILQMYYAAAQVVRVDDARQALRAVVQLDAGRAAAVDPYLARLREVERFLREREAAALWDRIQQNIVRQQLDAVQRDWAVLIDRFAGTDFVRVEKRREIQQLAATTGLPRP